MEEAESNSRDISVDDKKDKQVERSCNSLKSPQSENKPQLEVTKVGKKHISRRRKGASKPRKIEQTEPDLALSTSQVDGKGKSLDSVLQRVLKAKQVEQERSKNLCTIANPKKMIETLSIHHHRHGPKSVRASTTSPESVDSPSSLYSNERTEENMTDYSTIPSTEPFVKIRSRSSENISPDVLPVFEKSNSLQRSFSSDAVKTINSEYPCKPSSPKEIQDSMPSSPTENNSSFRVDSVNCKTINGNPTKNIVSMTSEMTLPTMIETSGIIASTMSPLAAIQQQQFFQNGSSFTGSKMSEMALQSNLNFNTTARGIIGSNGGAPRHTGSPSPEDRAQYKRPPHTYPALIASAILDSPGHLITLRGIYDYIMNHFPYYKYCHDKSAWQNSIRHNLSLNQCFVKVPRYENAAKSNYWTMTREGFEEFGNENSFKRRRRRGAALAPISAYKAKAKKYQYEAKTVRNKVDIRNHSSADSTSVKTNGSDEGFSVAFPSHLMGLAGPWTSEFHVEDNTGKSRKRSHSPNRDEGTKHPRMMVLKQGDGPTLGGVKSEDQKRPNSLSSVEEMQGTLNSFSKTLFDSSMLSKAPFHLLTTSSQPWIAAAQKSLMASSGMFMPSLLSTNLRSSSPGKSPIAEESKIPVIMEGVQIGSEFILHDDSSEVPIHQFRCQFCSFFDISNSQALLEQHVRMFHQLEITNARAKAVAAAAVAKTQSERSANTKSNTNQEQLLSLQNMVSGFSPMISACQSNAQNILAAAQANASNGSSKFPFTGTFPSGLLDESVLRTIAERVAVAGDRENSLPIIDAYAIQRQQTLNNVIQQAAATNSSTSSQEQLRFLYQQLSMQNPFLSNSASSLASAFPQQIPTSSNKQMWEYQQKWYNQMKALSDDALKRNSVLSRHNSENDEKSMNHANFSSHNSSPSRSPDVETDDRNSIHGWKQCTLCDFTAKGDHGLELHFRKVHAQSDAMTSSGPKEAPDRRSPNLELNEIELAESESRLQKNNCKEKFDEKCDSPLTSSAFPTPPLSNSPSYIKRHFAPLDLSGVKEEELGKSPTTVTTTSTQTAEVRNTTSENRSCHHCDIFFGDEMMHALHMSCHDKNDPFKCTICGQKCSEKYYFNVHLLRGLHQQPNNSMSDTSKSDLPQEGAPGYEQGEAISGQHDNNNEVTCATSFARKTSEVNEEMSLH